MLMSINSGKDIININYRFTFPSGEQKEFAIELDRDSLHMIPRGVKKPMNGRN